MQQANRIDAAGGREASRLRRQQLVAGKAGLPPARERVRTGEREASLPRVSSSAPAFTVPTPAASAAPVSTVTALEQAPATPAMVRPTGGRAASLARREALVQGKAALRQLNRAPAQANVAQPSANGFTPAPAAASPSGFPTGGRDASVARRNALVQGKKGLQQIGQTQGGSVAAAAPVNMPVATPAPATNEGASATSRQMAQAVRANRATFGRGGAAAARAAIGSHMAEPIQYPPKVADTSTYGGGRVTGVRIGRGPNVTGDEPGASLPVTGSQYYGTEAGFQPRHGGVKVGAARTERGLTVTGTLVRSQVEITGDEYKSSVRITGEADQAPQDDLTPGRERMAYSAAQFQRKSEPHGHSVFGTNLGRAAKSLPTRDRANALEASEGGLPISGTAIGRSARVTGDEEGAHRAITGDQYVTRGRGQPEPAARANANRGERIDPVTGSRVCESSTFGGQRVTGCNVEHKRNVTGDEYGATAYLTGTPYVGPGQVPADRHVTASGVARITGNTPLNVGHVTGTQRGADRAITGTTYFRAEASEAGDKADAKGNVVAEIEQRFSVRSPQREAQLRQSSAPVPEDVQERITGSFAVGRGKITGNQEFQFKPRVSAEQRESARNRITGEGRVEGPAITGGAWGEHGRVTGTDGYIAHERNPSQRAGKPHGFASSELFKDKGKHEPSKQMVTGMVGWSAKSAAKVTLSGGAQG